MKLFQAVLNRKTPCGEDDLLVFQDKNTQNLRLLPQLLVGGGSCEAYSKCHLYTWSEVISVKPGKLEE